MLYFIQGHHVDVVSNIKTIKGDSLFGFTVNRYSDTRYKNIFGVQIFAQMDWSNNEYVWDRTKSWLDSNHVNVLWKKVSDANEAIDFGIDYFSLVKLLEGVLNANKTFVFNMFVVHMDESVEKPGPQKWDCLWNIPMINYRKLDTYSVPRKGSMRCDINMLGLVEYIRNPKSIESFIDLLKRWALWAPYLF